MKLLTFLKDKQTRFGWLDDCQEYVISPNLKSPLGSLSLSEIIASGIDINQCFSNKTDELERFRLSEIRFREPITPGAIFCIGLNYAAHVEEVRKERTEKPTVFFRLPRSHVAHKQSLMTPIDNDTHDWEGELAVIVGTSGRHIKPENAYTHVFGYSIYNDGTIRDYQRHTTQFGLGKNFESSGAFGPWIVTADEFGDPYQHSLETWIDDHQVQSTSINLMLHRIENLIAYISSACTLQSGDVICTGTPSGVGAGMKPKRFLKAEETVRISISGIGTLSNTVVDDQPVLAG